MDTEIATALSKALAYAAIENEESERKAREWTRRLVVLLRDAGLPVMVSADQP